MEENVIIAMDAEKSKKDKRHSFKLGLGGYSFLPHY